MFQGQMNCDHTSLLTILRRLQKEPQKSLLDHSSVEDQPFNMQHVCEVEADELGGDLRPYSCFELLENTSASSERLHWISKGYNTVTTHLHVTWG